MKKYIPIILLIIILAIAFLLRSRMFLSGDFYFLPDQGRDMQLVKTIAVDHKLSLIGGRSGLGGIFHGPLWWYMIVPFFLLSGGNPFYTLVPLYYIISFAIVLSGFFIGRRLYGNYAGFLILILLAVSGEFTGTIPFTSNSHVMPLVLLFYLYTIILFIRGNDKAIIFSLLCIGLGLHFESAFAILLIPLTIFACIFRRHIPKLSDLLSGVGLFILSISNFILFDLRHQFLMTHSVITLLTGHVKPDKANIAYANIFFRIHDRIWWFFSTFKTAIYTENTVTTFFLFLVLTCGAMLIFQSFMKKRMHDDERESIFLFLFLLLSFIFYILYPLPLQAHYVQALSIVAIFLLALSIKIMSRKKVGLLLTVIFLFVNIYPALGWISQNYGTGKKYEIGNEGSYQNQLRVIRYVFQDAHQKPFGYFVYDIPIFTYGMDYLMWWQGKTKFHYLPDSKKLPLTYLIMLPSPPNDVHAHDFWKRNVVRTKGAIITEKLFPGNIDVQKLAIDQKEGPADPNYYQNLIFR